MYETTWYINDYGDIKASCRNEANQHVVIEFTKWYSHNKAELVNNYINHWYIKLWIGKRKYGFQQYKQTGKDGLRSLLWAKQQLVRFISELEDGWDHVIIIQWDDTRRKNTYIRAVKGMHFNIGKVDGRDSLILRINKRG